MPAPAPTGREVTIECTPTAAPNRFTAFVVLAVLCFALCEFEYASRRSHRLLSNDYTHMFDHSAVAGSSRTVTATPLVGNQCVSQASGNWNTAGTWTNCGGVVPTSADDV